MEDDLARYVYSDPIEEYVAELTTDEDLPVAGIEACTARYDEAGPLLRAAISRAADGTLVDANDERLFARALFIAGLRRDPSACEPLLRALRQPHDDVVLDDAVVDFLPRIVAGVFDGNAEALFEAIADQRLDEFVREKLFGAATFLTWEGRIEREHLERFLERFEVEGLVPDEDYAWVGWLTAVSLLSLRRLEPNAARVLGKETLSDFMSREELAAELGSAEQSPRDSARLDKANLGYIDSTDDILEALAWFADADKVWDEDSAPGDEDDEPLPDQPVINPWRHVGRNDPCPCGSGKKAKRCCLAA